MDDTEEILLQIEECFVYKVPPRTSSDGYRAEIWGLDKPMETCVLRVVTVGDNIHVRLVHGRKPGDVTDKLFATAVIPAIEALERGIDHFVEPVIDSSRYFVLRLVNSATGRVAYLGAGFRERQNAFDFRATLTDHLKYVERQRKGLDAALDTGGTIRLTDENDDVTEVQIADVLQPLSLGTGSGGSLRLTVKSLGKRDCPPSVAAAGGERRSSGLAPPPKAGPAVAPPSSFLSPPSIPVPAPLRDDKAEADDEWGEFQSS